MKCPRCKWPMHLGRYHPGECKVFHCESCRSRLSAREKRRSGFNGSVIINSRIPITHQERI